MATHDPLPSIWRTQRTLLVIVWVIVLVTATMFVVYTRGTLTISEWIVPVLLLVGLGLVFTVGFIVSAWRIRRVLRVFTEGLSDTPRAGADSSWDLVLRWPDDDVEVRGTAAFFFIWNLKVQLPGESWTFDPRAAPVVLRYVRDRLAAGTQAPDTHIRPVPWGLTPWLAWATPPFGAALLALVVDLTVARDAALAVWIGATFFGYVLLVWGRMRARSAMGALVHGLHEAGLRVDGPHLVEAGPAMRFVVFTDQGGLTVHVAVLGPLARFRAHWSGGAHEFVPAQLDTATVEIARAVSSGPEAAVTTP